MMIKKLRYAAVILGLRTSRLWGSFWGYLLFIWSGAKVGKGLRIHGGIDLNCHPSGRLEVGDRLRINSGFLPNPVGGDRKAGILVGKGASLRIGDSTGLSSCTIICLDEIWIGSNVLVGGGVSIFDSDFHPLDPTKRRLSGVPGATAPIEIQDDVFIGAGAMILKGAKIGKGAVIGASSVVVGEVPAMEVWAGNPARRIKALLPLGDPLDLR